ncbi:MAG: hypothetical protein ACLUOI_26760 [Eisenbergiella sp.]
MVGNKERRYQLILTIVMTLISLVMVIPLILLLMASVTSNNEIVMHYSFWPKEFSLKHIGTYGMKRGRFSGHMVLHLW